VSARLNSHHRTTIRRTGSPRSTQRSEPHAHHQEPKPAAVRGLQDGAGRDQSQRRRLEETLRDVRARRQACRRPRPRTPKDGAPASGENGGAIMTTDKKPVLFDIEQLNALAVRLSDRADQISQITLWDLARDLRLAAQVTAKLATLRFRIAEIAGELLAHPEWDGAAVARDLRDALADAKEGE
jgi:hypothetical protein